MDPYGTVSFSFRGTASHLWAALVLGIALLAAGGLMGLVFAVEGTAITSLEDALGAVAVFGLFFGGGAVALLWSTYLLVRRSEWHVSSTHLYCTRGTRILRAYDLAELPAPTLIPLGAYGQPLGVQMHFGQPSWWRNSGETLVVPSMDIAEGIVALWQERHR